MIIFLGRCTTDPFAWKMMLYSIALDKCQSNHSGLPSIVGMALTTQTNPNKRWMHSVFSVWGWGYRMVGQGMYISHSQKGRKYEYDERRS